MSKGVVAKLTINFAVFNHQQEWIQEQVSRDFKRNPVFGQIAAGLFRVPLE